MGRPGRIPRLVQRSTFDNGRSGRQPLPRRSVQWPCPEVSPETWRRRRETRWTRVAVFAVEKLETVGAGIVGALYERPLFVELMKYGVTDRPYSYLVMPHQTVCLLPPSVLQTRRPTLAVSGHLRGDTEG